MQCHEQALVSCNGERVFIGDSGGVRVFDISTGALELCIELPLSLPLELYKLVMTDSTLLAYSSSGQVIIFNMHKLCPVSSFQMSLKSSQLISVVTASTKDDVFFLATTATMNVHCISGGKVSAPILVDSKTSKPAPISAMICHPKSSILFLSKSGNIHACSYSAVLRNISSVSSFNRGNGAEVGHQLTDTRQSNFIDKTPNSKALSMTLLCTLTAASSSSDITLVSVNRDGTLVCASLKLNGKDVLHVYDVSKIESTHSSLLVATYTFPTEVCPYRLVFHSSEPEVIALSEETISTTKYAVLQKFSLLSKTLLKTSSLYLSNPSSATTAVLYCSPHSHCIVTSLSSGSASKTIVTTKSPWTQSIYQSTTNKLNIPLDNFLASDEATDSQLNGSHPVVLISPGVSLSGDAPLEVIYHIFASSLVVTSKASVRHLGPLMGKSNSTWKDIPADLTVKGRVVFIPGSTCQILPESGHLADQPWRGVINGHRVDNLIDGAFAPSVCLVKYANSTITSAVTTSVWAALVKSTLLGLPHDCVLLLDASLKSMKCMSYANDSMGKTLHEWTLPVPMKKFWVSPDGITPVLLAYSIDKVNSSCSLLLFDLVLPTPFVTSAASKSIALDAIEEALEVAWLPISSKSYMSSLHGYIGVCTSTRVLIVNGSFEIAASIRLTNEIATSCCWIGLSLAYMTDAGRVDYLVPGEMNISSEFSSRATQLAACGVTCNDVVNRSLFSMPTSYASYTTSRLVACLPDRAMVTMCSPLSATSSESCLVKLYTKPYVPCDPLAHGLLWLFAKSTSKEVRDAIKVDIAALLRVYLASKHGQGTENGAVPTMQSSLFLVYALFCSGLPEYAAAVAGIDLSAANVSSVVSDGELPRFRWISGILKYEILKNMRCYDRACFELLALYPDALEMLSDPEGASAGVPRKNGYVSSLCAAAASDLMQAGQTELAARLADISGDDTALAIVLKSTGRSAELTSLLSVASSIKPVLGSNLSPTTSVTEQSHNIYLSSIGDTARRTSAFITKPLAPSGFKPSFILSESELKKCEIARGGGIGPLSHLGILAMDSVEDWMGSQAPEVLQVGTKSAPIRSKDNEVQRPSASAGTTSKSNWVQDVGKGKEWDLCSGYWRFSDIVRPGEEDFVSSCAPHARVNIVDLSKFGTPLEVFAENTSQICLEPTTSSIDPGEDHEKVKALYDVVTGECSNAGGGSGLRAMVYRGGALDVGLCHTDPERQRFTLELCIYKSEGIVLSSRNVIAARHVYQDSKTGAAMWTLEVDSVGNLCFQFGKDSSVIKTGDGSVNLGPTQEITVPLWTHIVMVMDSSENDSGEVSISLFINGSLATKSQCQAPSFTEKELSASVLVIGPGLSGWRYTELRLWACARSADDLENSRENYLSLASKRKRLQYRIKGGKKLFGPLSSLVIGEPGVLTAPKGLEVDTEVVESVTKKPTVEIRSGSALKTKALPLIAATRMKQNKKEAEEFNPFELTSMSVPPTIESNTSEIKTTDTGSLYSFGLCVDDLTSTSLITSPHCVYDRVVLCKDNEIWIISITHLKLLPPVKYKLSAESAILSPRKDSNIIALYKQNKMSVFNIDTRKKIGEQAITTQLLFWKFVSEDLILLVTPSVVYTWSINPSVLSGPDSRPKKICSRDKSLSEEVVIDAYFDGRWTVLETKPPGSRAFTVYCSSTGLGRRIEAIAGLLSTTSPSTELTCSWLQLTVDENSGVLQLCSKELSSDLQDNTKWTYRLEDTKDNGSLWFIIDQSVEGHILVVNSQGVLHAVNAVSGARTVVSKLRHTDKSVESLLSIETQRNAPFTSLILKESGTVLTCANEEISVLCK